jgi:hypothetical protein
LQGKLTFCFLSFAEDQGAEFNISMSKSAPPN